MEGTEILREEPGDAGWKIELPTGKARCAILNRRKFLHIFGSLYGTLITLDVAGNRKVQDDTACIYKLTALGTRMPIHALFLRD